MKQVLKAVGLVLLLLTSCSKDDSNPNNGNGNVTPPVEQKAIVITSYSKNYGYAGDSVDILGENFPKKEQCKVTFGNTEATITSVSADGKKLTLVLPRSSTYLPELKFYFGEKTVVDNKVTNDYEQKIGIIDKVVGQWVKTQWDVAKEITYIVHKYGINPLEILWFLAKIMVSLGKNGQIQVYGVIFLIFILPPLTKV